MQIIYPAICEEKHWNISCSRHCKLYHRSPRCNSYLNICNLLAFKRFRRRLNLWENDVRSEYLWISFPRFSSYQVTKQLDDRVRKNFQLFFLWWIFSIGLRIKIQNRINERFEWFHLKCKRSHVHGSFFQYYPLYI